jgi:hypothetical protein
VGGLLVSVVKEDYKRLKIDLNKIPAEEKP